MDACLIENDIPLYSAFHNLHTTSIGYSRIKTRAYGQDLQMIKDNVLSHSTNQICTFLDTKKMPGFKLIQNADINKLNLGQTRSSIGIEKNNIAYPKSVHTYENNMNRFEMGVNEYPMEPEDDLLLNNVITVSARTSMGPYEADTADADIPISDQLPSLSLHEEDHQRSPIVASSNFNWHK